VKSRTIQGLGLAAAVAALAGCASSPPPRQPVARQVSPAPSATPGEHGLAAQATAFEGFMHHAAGIDAAFSGPAEVAQALQTGAAYEPKTMEAGVIAFAAMAALQEPRFVAAVRADRDRGELARRLSANPQAALALPGADAAAGRASSALYAQGDALAGEGRKVKQAAYSVQHQAWSKANVPDPAGRLSRVKRISAAGYQPSRDDAGRMQSSLSEGVRRGGAPSPLVARGVAVAALSVLGEDGKARSLMTDPKAAMCLRMAKLNLYQCLASAGPHYEDIFCLGQHAMIETGQCVVDATKAPVQRIAATKVSYPR
jgi:hypothetical protein